MKTKPFHANKSNDERRDWFSRTRPWHEIDPQLIHELVEKFDDDPLFEVFVITSMKLKLVGSYNNICKQGYIEGVGCTQISGILCKIGTSSVNEMSKLLQTRELNERKISHHYQIILDTLEPAICLDDKQLLAYLGLSSTYAMINKANDCQRIAKQGYKVATEIEEMGLPFHMSSVVPDAEQDIANIKQAFLDLIEETN